MKRSKKSVLIAMVLGDGYIHNDKRSKSFAIKLCHSIAQKEYTEYKANLLHSLLGGKAPSIRTYTCKSFNKEFKQVRFSKAHKYFRVLKKWMYPDKYNKNLLKHLDALGLAIWYMDDGSIAMNNRYPDGTCQSARTHLHLCTTKEKAQEVCDYFMDTWGIKFITFKDGKDTYSIRCFHKEGHKFHEIIHPYIIPSMAYKQRFYYGTSAQPLITKGDDIV